MNRRKLAQQYKQFRKSGETPEQIFLRAEADGLSWFQSLAVLQTLFKFSMLEAKAVSIRAHGGADSLAEHQEQLLPGLRKVLEEEEELAAKDGFDTATDRRA